MTDKMGDMTVDAIETELKKLIAVPAWKRKQSDDWDSRTNFIYGKPLFEDLQQELKSLHEQELKDYAINRWYNFWSAKGIERIFCDCTGVEPYFNPKDKKVDFTIKGINFDHKTSVFPRRFDKEIAYAKNHKKELIEWLYREQSHQGRYHVSNRLFVVLHKTDGLHWQLRKELHLLQPVIRNYINGFNEADLCTLNITPQALTLSDIIWFEA